MCFHNYQYIINTPFKIKMECMKCGKSHWLTRTYILDKFSLDSSFNNVYNDFIDQTNFEEIKI